MAKGKAKPARKKANKEPIKSSLSSKGRVTKKKDPVVNKIQTKKNPSKAAQKKFALFNAIKSNVEKLVPFPSENRRGAGASKKGKDRVTRSIIVKNENQPELKEKPMLKRATSTKKNLVKTIKGVVKDPEVVDGAKFTKSSKTKTPTNRKAKVEDKSTQERKRTNNKQQKVTAKSPKTPKKALPIKKTEVEEAVAKNQEISELSQKLEAIGSDCSSEDSDDSFFKNFVGSTEKSCAPDSQPFGVADSELFSPSKKTKKLSSKTTDVSPNTSPKKALSTSKKSNLSTSDEITTTGSETAGGVDLFKERRTKRSPKKSSKLRESEGLDVSDDEGIEVSKTDKKKTGRGGYTRGPYRKRGVSLDGGRGRGGRAGSIDGGRGRGRGRGRGGRGGQSRESLEGQEMGRGGQSTRGARGGIRGRGSRSLSKTNQSIPHVSEEVASTSQKVSRMEVDIVRPKDTNLVLKTPQLPIVERKSTVEEIETQKIVQRSNQVIKGNQVAVFTQDKNKAVSQIRYDEVFCGKYPYVDTNQQMVLMLNKEQKDAFQSENNNWGVVKSAIMGAHKVTLANRSMYKYNQTIRQDNRKLSLILKGLYENSVRDRNEATDLKRQLVVLQEKQELETRRTKSIWEELDKRTLEAETHFRVKEQQHLLRKSFQQKSEKVKAECDEKCKKLEREVISLSRENSHLIKKNEKIKEILKKQTKKLKGKDQKLGMKARGRYISSVLAAQSYFFKVLADTIADPDARREVVIRIELLLQSLLKFDQLYASSEVSSDCQPILSDIFRNLDNDPPIILPESLKAWQEKFDNCNVKPLKTTKSESEKDSGSLTGGAETEDFVFRSVPVANAGNSYADSVIDVDDDSDVEIEEEFNEVEVMSQMSSDKEELDEVQSRKQLPDKFNYVPFGDTNTVDVITVEEDDNSQASCTEQNEVIIEDESFQISDNEDDCKIVEDNSRKTKFYVPQLPESTSKNLSDEDDSDIECVIEVPKSNPPIIPDESDDSDDEIDDSSDSLVLDGNITYHEITDPYEYYESKLKTPDPITQGKEQFRSQINEDAGVDEVNAENEAVIKGDDVSQNLLVSEEEVIQEIVIENFNENQLLDDAVEFYATVDRSSESNSIFDVEEKPNFSDIDKKLRDDAGDKPSFLDRITMSVQEAAQLKTNIVPENTSESKNATGTEDTVVNKCDETIPLLVVVADPSRPQSSNLKAVFQKKDLEQGLREREESGIVIVDNQQDLSKPPVQKPEELTKSVVTHNPPVNETKESEEFKKPVNSFKLPAVSVPKPQMKKPEELKKSVRTNQLPASFMSKPQMKKPEELKKSPEDNSPYTRRQSLRNKINSSMREIIPVKNAQPCMAKKLELQISEKVNERPKAGKSLNSSECKRSSAMAMSSSSGADESDLEDENVASPTKKNPFLPDSGVPPVERKGKKLEPDPEAGMYNTAPKSRVSRVADKTLVSVTPSAMLTQPKRSACSSIDAASQSARSKLISPLERYRMKMADPPPSVKTSGSPLQKRRRMTKTKADLGTPNLKKTQPKVPQEPLATPLLPLPAGEMTQNNPGTLPPVHGSLPSSEMYEMMRNMLGQMMMGMGYANPTLVANPAAQQLCPQQSIISNLFPTPVTPHPSAAPRPGQTTETPVPAVPGLGFFPNPLATHANVPLPGTPSVAGISEIKPSPKKPTRPRKQPMCRQIKSKGLKVKMPTRPSRQTSIVSISEDEQHNTSSESKESSVAVEKMGGAGEEKTYDVFHVQVPPLEVGFRRIEEEAKKKIYLQMELDKKCTESQGNLINGVSSTDSGILEDDLFLSDSESTSDAVEYNECPRSPVPESSDDHQVDKWASLSSAQVNPSVHVMNEVIGMTKLELSQCINGDQQMKGFRDLPPAVGIAKTVYQIIFEDTEVMEKAHDDRDLPISTAAQKILMGIQILAKMYVMYKELPSMVMEYFTTQIIPNPRYQFKEYNENLIKLGRFYGALSRKFNLVEDIKKMIFETLYWKPPLAFALSYGILCLNSDMFSTLPFEKFGFTDRAILFALINTPQFNDAKYFPHVRSLLKQSLQIVIPELTYEQFVELMLEEIKVLEEDTVLKKASKAVSMLCLQARWEWFDGFIKNRLMDWIQGWRESKITDAVLASFISVIGDVINDSIVHADMSGFLDVVSTLKKINSSIMHPILKNAIQTSYAKIEQKILMMQTGQPKAWAYDKKYSPNRRNITKKKNKGKKKKALKNKATATRKKEMIKAAEELLKKE